MMMNSSGRAILLLAAEDAFEFERWRDAGPVTADIDPEIKAAEIAEFEALSIPLPSELDSLRRELEHAPKIREAIRGSALAMRRSGRATASALVALGPQQLMPTGAGGAAWGWPMGMDPRLAAAMNQRLAEFGDPRRRGSGSGDRDAEPRRRGRSRVGASVESLAEDEAVLDDHLPIDDGPLRGDGPVDAEVVDDFADEDDDELDEPRRRAPTAQRRSGKRRGEARRAQAVRTRDEWDEDDSPDYDDDPFDSAVAARPVRSDPRTTWILGGISVAAVLALMWVAFDKGAAPDPAAVALAQQQQQQQQQAPQQLAAPAPAPAELVDPNGGVDPATGLPYVQAPAEAAPAPANTGARSGRRSSGVAGVRGSSSGSSSGGVNPFASYKTPDDPAALASNSGQPGTGSGTAPTPGPGGATQPAAGGAGAQPANGATPSATGDSATPPAATDGAAGTAGTGEPAPAEPPKPVEAKPVEAPKPEPPPLSKVKMTPAIRTAVVSKVGDLQACYQDAVVGKPDLAGQVVFTISLDQDGVVKKVEIGKDEVKYGVAKCSAKKIKRWTLPSAGIPIVFDLPFDFQS